MGFTILMMIWFGIGALTAAVAQARNRNSTGWFLLGLVMPLFALLALIGMPVLTEKEKPKGLPRSAADGKLTGTGKWRSYSGLTKW